MGSTRRSPEIKTRNQEVVDNSVDKSSAVDDFINLHVYPHVASRKSAFPSLEQLQQSLEEFNQSKGTTINIQDVVADLKFRVIFNYNPGKDRSPIALTDAYSQLMIRLAANR